MSQELFRIVCESCGQKMTFDAGDDEPEARRRFEWHRSVVPTSVVMHLERQDVTPRPWERLNA